LQTFYLEVESFIKNEDKFGWVKYWPMTFNLPNSPKFSPATILHYTVVAFFKLQARWMINVGKVREGEQINVMCCSHDKLVVFWLFCIE